MRLIDSTDFGADSTSGQMKKGDWFLWSITLRLMPRICVRIACKSLPCLPRITLPEYLKTTLRTLPEAVGTAFQVPSCKTLVKSMLS